MKMTKFTQLSREQLRKVVGGMTQSQAPMCGLVAGGAVCPTGQCCSAFGYCGTTHPYCCISEGCQSEFGTCLDC